MVVIGFGGHGRVVCSALRSGGREVICVTDAAVQQFAGETELSQLEVLDDEKMLERFSPNDVELALGVGSVLPCGLNGPRRKIVNRFRERGFRFTSFVHPAAWVAPDVRIGEGAQIHAGAVVQPGASIGAFTILNTRSSVDHDCEIGEFCHLAPGVTLSGEVTIGSGAHLGTGCNVIQGLAIGREAFVAAGATVVRNVNVGDWVRGIPAQPFARRER